MVVRKMLSVSRINLHHIYNTKDISNLETLGQSCTIFWIVQFIELSMPTLYLLYSRKLKSFQSTYISSFWTFLVVSQGIGLFFNFWKKVQLEDQELNYYTTRYIVLRTNKKRTRKLRMIVLSHVQKWIPRMFRKYHL